MPRKILPVNLDRASLNLCWNVDKSIFTIGDRRNTDVVASSPIEFDSATWILQVAKSSE